MSTDDPPAREHIEAGTCDDCGHPVGGTIATTDPDAAIVRCDQCADGDRPYGVFVRDRTHETDTRWYPGRGEERKMEP